MQEIKMQDIEAVIAMHHQLTDGLEGEAFARYRKVILFALEEKIERDKITCENCKYIRVSGDNVCWCSCSSGLDGARRLSDFCSYFKIKEMPA